MPFVLGASPDQRPLGEDVEVACGAGATTGPARRLLDEHRVRKTEPDAGLVGDLIEPSLDANPRTNLLKLLLDSGRCEDARISRSGRTRRLLRGSCRRHGGGALCEGVRCRADGNAGAERNPRGIANRETAESDCHRTNSPRTPLDKNRIKRDGSIGAIEHV